MSFEFWRCLPQSEASPTEVLNGFAPSLDLALLSLSHSLSLFLSACLTPIFRYIFYLIAFAVDAGTKHTQEKIQTTSHTRRQAEGH